MTLLGAHHILHVSRVRVKRSEHGSTIFLKIQEPLQHYGYQKSDMKQVPYPERANIRRHQPKLICLPKPDVLGLSKVQSF